MSGVVLVDRVLNVSPSDVIGLDEPVEDNFRSSKSKVSEAADFLPFELGVAVPFADKSLSSRGM